MSVSLSDIPSDAHPELDSRSVRTVLASSLVGTSIEWYDFFLYSTAASLVFGKLFFPTSDSTVGTLLAFVTFFVGFVARPIGGILFGHIGDRIGRKQTLVSTMLLMGVATALIGVLPTYDAIGAWAPILLVVLRVVQGLATGGEWAGAVLLAFEHAPAHRRGFYASWPQVGLAIGLALGTGIFALLSRVLTERQFLTWGWRSAFLLSVVLVLVGLLIRLKVDETPSFRRVRELDRRASIPIVSLFTTAATLRATALGLLARWADGAAFNTWAVFAITYATATLGHARTDVLIAITAGALLMAVLIPVMGARADRHTPRRMYAAGTAVFGALVFPAFALMNTGHFAWFAVVVVVALGVVYAVTYAPEGTLFAQLFPVPVRYTGMSFVYQFSGIYASGLTPIIITGLLAVGGGTPWWAATYLVGTAVVSVAATLAIRPRHLHG